MKHLKNKTGFAHLIPLAVAVVLIVIATMVVNQTQNKSVTHAPASLPEIDFDEAKQELSSVFGNNVSYIKDETGIEYYDSYFEKDYDGYAVVSYKYIPGETIVEGAYESIAWKNNLDDEVNSFKSLKLGTQTALSCAAFECDPSAEVTLINSGSQNWASIEYFFPLSLSYHKTYYTFDEQSQQMIYVFVYYQNIARENSKDIYTSYPEIKVFNSEIESKILNL